MLAGCPGRPVLAARREHQQLLVLLGLGPFGTCCLGFLRGALSAQEVSSLW